MPLTVLCGGLFLDNLPMKNFSYIEEGNKRINQLTGAEFDSFLSKIGGGRDF